MFGMSGILGIGMTVFSLTELPMPWPVQAEGRFAS